VSPSDTTVRARTESEHGVVTGFSFQSSSIWRDPKVVALDEIVSTSKQAKVGLQLVTAFKPEVES
jgi:hypothetical protein